MRFPREFRGYISDPRAIASARVLPLKFTYWFRLHIFVAFLVSLILLPQVVGILENFGQAIEQLPNGVTIQKKGEVFTVTGVPQPINLETSAGFITIDTTGVTTARPASSTIFVSNTALVVGELGGGEEQKVVWGDMNDIKFTSDDIKASFREHMTLVITVAAIVMFAYFTVMTMITSAALIAVWSLMYVAVQRIFGKQGGYTLREVVAVGMVAITGPLVLWALFTVIHIPVGVLVEIIAFIVYSSVGLRASVREPQAGSGEKK